MSRSPRRRELLSAAGIEHEVATPEFEDAHLEPHHEDPEQWVASLALLKAAAGVRTALEGVVVLGADTACIKNGKLIGTPTSAPEARQMLRTLRDGEHDVITGVALIEPATGRRSVFVDRASVHMGWVPDDQIDAYVDSGAWQGKAGGYNLNERVAAGWPVRSAGDPTTVMGLPIQRLTAALERLSASALTYSMLASSALITPWVVMPVAAVSLLIVAVHLESVRRSAMDHVRKRIRVANAWLMLVLVPLVAFGLVYAPPATSDVSRARVFVFVWILVGGLLGLVVILALLDVLNTYRIRREQQRKLRQGLGRLREEMAGGPRG